MSKITILPRSLPAFVSYYHEHYRYIIEVEISGPDTIKVEFNGKVKSYTINVELPIQLIIEGLELIEVITLDKPELMEPELMVDDEW